MTDNCQVLFQEYPTADGRQIGRATLSAPESLNALTLAMIDALYGRLLAWQQSEQVVAVIVDGAGSKAFCAGGDIRRLYDSVLACDYGPNAYGESFFTREYRLDFLIHTFGKPVLCWGSGIVMGGGIGLMAGASHRVVTPSSKLAMPEVSIGLFPDVGGSWILGRMPGRVGLFLGLTGTRLNAGDALFCGLADRVMADDALHGVIAAMAGESWGECQKSHHALLTRLLKGAALASESVPDSVIKDNFDQIQTVTDGDSPAAILALLKKQPGRWWQRAADGLEQGCPLTAGLVMEQLRRARHLSLADIFRMELNIAVNCLRRPNFAEGVRALLLERGSQPNWQPASLDDLRADQILACFGSPWQAHEHPLVDLSVSVSIC